MRYTFCNQVYIRTPAKHKRHSLSLFFVGFQFHQQACVSECREEMETPRWAISQIGERFYFPNFNTPGATQKQMHDIESALMPLGPFGNEFFGHSHERTGEMQHLLPLSVCKNESLVFARGGAAQR